MFQDKVGTLTMFIVMTDYINQCIGMAVLCISGFFSFVFERLWSSMG